MALLPFGYHVLPKVLIAVKDDESSCDVPKQPRNKPWGTLTDGLGFLHLADIHPEIGNRSCRGRWQGVVIAQEQSK